MNTKNKSTKPSPRKSTPLTVLRPHCAGIDLGSREHYVAIPPECCDQPIRAFGVFTADHRELIRWLQSHRIKHVAMEATGVYWMALFSALEKAKFEVALVDPRKAKNVSGRKTDVSDAEWIRRLHSYGLLEPAFVPPQSVRTLRHLWRHRRGLRDQIARAIQLMHKPLEMMNLHLHKVLSDVSGVSGMAIIRAILEGRQEPETLVELLDGGVKASKEEVIEALRGQYREEYLLTLRQAVEAYDFHQCQIETCDRMLQQQLKRLEPKPAPGSETALPEGPMSYSRRKNQPYFDLEEQLRKTYGVDLTLIEGISALTAQTVFAEVGAELSRFPTEKHFASWLGLSPNNRITGGKVKSRRTRRVSQPLATALRIAAQSLHRSKSALGAFLRRMKLRIGMAKAITATARKLAERIYWMLRYGMEYVQRGAAAYEEQHRQRQMRSMQRRAAELGFDLVERQTGVVLV